MKYTLTFDITEKNKFSAILSRLNDEEYTIIEDISIVSDTNKYVSECRTIIDMDTECALTFKMGMKTVKLRKERSAEELEQEKERNDRHVVSVTVKIPTT